MSLDADDAKFFVPPSTPPQDTEADTGPPLLPNPTMPFQSPISPAWHYGRWGIPNTPLTPWSTSSGTSTPWSSIASPVFPAPQRKLSIHRHLCHSIRNPGAPPELMWDVIHPPDFARVINPQESIFWGKPDLDADAVRPAVKKVWIDCDHQVLGFWFHKWGPITVTSDRVTVRDILERIYKYLRTPLTEDDLREVYSLPGNEDGLQMARERRAMDSHEIDAVVLSSGYRRVDVAGSHRRFQGVQMVVYPDHTWRLHFNLLPDTVPQQY